jgi:serine phosphatase RsbU (regulator of sigma subunit)
VGDVSGKGMPAALLMAASVASFRSLVVQRLAPATFLAQMDTALASYIGSTRQNCALVYLYITAYPAQVFTVQVSNAGCVTPIIRHANGRVVWVDVGGFPLGVGLGASIGYQEATLTLDPGDMIILTSDGVLEARNAQGDMFGFERLEQAVRQAPATTTSAMMHYLRATVEAFVGEQEAHDDVTIVVIRI